jgi:hypothetical protein
MSIDICGYVYPGTYYASMCKRRVGYAQGANGKYYRVVHRTNLNYTQAKAACEADWTKLATAPYGLLDKRAMERYVMPLIAVIKDGNNDPTIWGYWVDGSDASVEGTWQLPDGTKNTSKMTRRTIFDK